MAESIQITLPDGSSKAAPAGIRVGDFVKDSIGAGLAKAAVFARVERQGGRPHPHARPRREAGRSSPRRAPRRWRPSATTPRTSSPSAVQRLFPGTQVTIGPTIEDGFYYDFYRDKPFTPEDLEQIEAEANKEIAAEPRPSCARRSRWTTRSSSSSQGREVQGRDHQGHRRQGREDADALPPRRLGRLLPRAPRPLDRARSA